MAISNVWNKLCLLFSANCHLVIQLNLFDRINDANMYSLKHLMKHVPGSAKHSGYSIKYDPAGMQNKNAKCHSLDDNAKQLCSDAWPLLCSFRNINIAVMLWMFQIILNFIFFYFMTSCSGLFCVLRYIRVLLIHNSFTDLTHFLPAIIQEQVRFTMCTYHFDFQWPKA